MYVPSFSAIDRPPDPDLPRYRQFLFVGFRQYTVGKKKTKKTVEGTRRKEKERRRRKKKKKKKEHYGVRGDSIAITLTHVECRTCRVGNYNSTSRSRGLMHFGWGGRGGEDKEKGRRAMVFTRTIVDR